MMKMYLLSSERIRFMQWLEQAVIDNGFWLRKMKDDEKIEIKSNEIEAMKTVLKTLRKIEDYHEVKYNSKRQ